jgi:hypothetical protein
MKNKIWIGLLVGIIVLAFQACRPSETNFPSQENGTGYSGLRPEAGVYSARLTCPAGQEGFENLTVKDESDTVLIENECSQQSKEVNIANVDIKPYRKEHVTHDNQIYEKNLPREPEYFNEALCDFADKSFGILIRWYDVHLFHVGHIFTMGGMEAKPVIRFSDVTLDDGHFGTGYMGENFSLAVINSFRIEQGFAGIFTGKVAGADIVEAFGYCVTTIYDCKPIQLAVTSTGTSGQYSIQTLGTSDTNVVGTLGFTGDLANLQLDVTLSDGKTYDCNGYVFREANELTVGGCKDRPTDGSDPKQVMIQIRGKIDWQPGNESGTVNSKVCIGNSVLKDP